MKTNRTTSKNLRRLAAGLLIASFATLAYAQGEDTWTTTPKPSSSDTRSADQKFLQKAYASSSEEAYISRVVAQRSTNPAVRDLANQLATSHADLDSKIEKLAASEGITLASRDKDNTKAMEKWSDKSAKSLDEDYVDNLVDAHEDTIALFEDVAKGTKNDPDVAAFARTTLPVLQAHFAQAKQLDKSM